MLDSLVDALTSDALGPTRNGHAAVDLDTALELLADERRRRVLRLLAADPETHLGTLAEEVAATEHNVTVEALTGEQRKRLYVSLYQTHLPKLDAADAVAFDAEEGRVRLTARGETLLAALEAVEAQPGVSA